MTRYARQRRGRQKLSIKEQVDGFVGQVERLVVQCSLAKRHEETADVFLWAAWRCLEATLRALLVPYPPRNFTELDVKGLLDDAVQRTIVPNDLAPTFESVWRVSRRGARVRDHELPDFSDGVLQCAQELARLVTWLYERSPAKRPMPSSVERALAVLATGEGLASREEAAFQRQQSLLQELERSLAERSNGIATLESGGDVPGDILAAQSKELEAAEARLAALRSEMVEDQGYPRFSVAASRSGSGGELWQRWRGVASLVAGACVGIFAALIFLGWDSRNAPSVEGSPDAAAEGSEVDAAPGKQRGGEQSASRPDDASPPAAGDLPAGGGTPLAKCPARMIKYETADIRVRQPFPRKSWPPGPKKLKASLVKGFCLDRGPVLVSQYEKCVAADECRPRGKCLNHPRNFPVNCVPWQEAANYCRWRGGALPSVEQWERTLLFGGKQRAELTTGTWEWTLDPFPAPIFERGHIKRNDNGSIWGYMALQKQFTTQGGTRLCSWHKAPANVLRGNLSFRCARPLLEKIASSPADEDEPAKAPAALPEPAAAPITKSSGSSEQ